MNLFIFKYNNYYNRILKKENTLEEYGNPIYVYEPQSFNPNDGVDTAVLVGDFYNPYDGTGDYVILEEDGAIISRWFIIEAAFETAKAQWNLTLRRDLLVDFYDHYIDTDCFIEKATLNAEDPLLFNSEDMNFNQIKDLEYPLRDETLSAWVVGYYAKNTAADNLSGTLAVNVPDSMYDIQIAVPFVNWEFNATTNPIKVGINALDYFIYASRNDPYTNRVRLPGKYKITSGGNYLGFEADPITSGKSYALNCSYDGGARTFASKIKEQKATLFEQAKAYLTANILSDSKKAEFLSLNGKIIRDSTGVFYELTIYQESITYETASVKAGSLFNSLKNIAASIDEFTGTPDGGSFQVLASYNNYRMKARRLTNLETSWNIAPTADWQPLITEDAPYNIFAIPFDSCKLKTGIMSEDIYRNDPTYTLPIVESMIRAMGSSLYDIQLLPYCPVNYIGENLVDVKSPSAYTLIKDASDNIVSFILHVPQTKISRNIQLDYFAIPKPENAIETKISNECYKYRLCSPNFNGYFDFSAAKNGGVDFINVDMTLKPFQPYIHLNPNFGGLYGRDFDDPRGLICGGDFSLSQFKDKWQEYQLNNKNYQEIFDRQIQNMEVQNKYQRKSEQLQVGIGTAQGAATGAVIGGPGWGGVIGAAVGGTASLVGGLGDLAINDKLRTEAMDYTKDMFGYQLCNIQALPYTLTKVSAFNNNNKIFPLLERYTCTDREKDAFAKKLAYNGMTTMIIDKPSKYIGNSWSRELSDGEILENKGYIKGRIIRIETLEDEFHLLKSISDELYKGVYIK